MIIGLSRKATEIGSRKKIGSSDLVPGPDAMHRMMTMITSTLVDAQMYHQRIGPRKIRINQIIAPTA